MDPSKLKLFSDSSNEVSKDCSGLNNDADDLEIGDKIESASDNDDKSEESISDQEALEQHEEPTYLLYVGLTLVNMTKNLASHHLETHKYLIKFFTMQYCKLIFFS